LKKVDPQPHPKAALRAALQNAIATNAALGVRELLECGGHRRFVARQSTKTPSK